MPARPTVTHSGNYRPPHVSGVVNRPDISSEKGYAEEEQEWSDDSDSQESNLYPHRVSPLNSNRYDENFNELQNSMVKRVKTQPTTDYTPYTPNAEYGRYDSTRASRGYSNTSSNSPSGQAVPYDGNPFMPYRGQQYNPSPQYYSPHPQNIPPPPQYYPSADPEVESIRKELEDMRMESREKEKRRLEEQRVEENRKKKKRAELKQKRKAKEKEQAQKLAFELKIQEVKADYERRLESELKAARPRDQTADLYDILSKVLPLQPAAGHYGHGYGCNAQDKQSHDVSMIMRKLESLAAPEWQAPPNRWFDGQGPSTRYHNDRPLIDDLRHQIDDMKHHYRQLISTLLPQQRWAGQLADGEYYPPYGPGHPMPQPPVSPWTSSSSNQPDPPELIRLPRRVRAGGPRGRGPPYPTAFFSGFEEPENVASQQRNRNYRRYADDEHDYSDGENSASAAVAGRLVDENRQAAESNTRKVRKQQPLPQPLPLKKARASKNDNPTRVAVYDSNSMVARQIDSEKEEYGSDSDHSSDASDEVEALKHRSSRYVGKLDAQFRREEFQAKSHHPQPFDQFPYGAEDHAFSAPSPPPPPIANEDFEVLPR
ncbi:hypothetical protein F4680DRAFT_24132 [Xylaria scruposa]|nr:hypothetical protein F4680DRAFT_24132 [Xylaria scruposa]